MLNKILLLIGCLFMSASAQADRSVEVYEIDFPPGFDYVECLDLWVEIDEHLSGFVHEFYDQSGRGHVMVTGALSGEYTEIEGSGKSWTLKKGRYHLSGLNIDGDSTDPIDGQAMKVERIRETAKANGDYPDLKFSFSFGATVNANGDVVSWRVDEGTYKCIYH